MKLEKGKKYDLDNLRPVWWNENGVTLEAAPEGYNCWQYFDSEKRYLGPDIDGIEPEFELIAEPYASKFARKGGQVKSPAKTAAARENAKKGGRPKKVKP